MQDASRRLLVEPETDLLARRAVAEELAVGAMDAVRRAVLAGQRLAFDYVTNDGDPAERVVDPIGLVTVRGGTYLVATRSGLDRTYRLSRMTSAEVLPEPARRPDTIDLDRIWAERTAAFLSADQLPVTVLVRTARRDELLASARAVRAEAPPDDGWAQLDVMFEDVRHAAWAIWQLGTDAVVVSPDALRAALLERARALVACYEP